MASPDQPIAYILGTFPQASQTFIAREIRGLRARGVPLRVYALARRSRDLLEPPDRVWFDDVTFAPFWLSPAVIAALVGWLVRDPGRTVRALGRILTLPHRPRWLVVRAVALGAVGAWIARDIARAGGCRHVHAHFALAQTEVAMVVAALLERPFSFTAHARDIYATPSALDEKMRAASLVVTCTAYNSDYLRQRCPDLPPAHVTLVHHGVTLADRTSAVRSHRTAPTLAAAGRLVEKKGFEVLIDACRLLRDRGVLFHCAIYGSGPLQRKLAEAIAAARLSTDVVLPGWIDGEALSHALASSDVFVMPSQVSKEGDRDGIPNVVLEAMAAGLPVVATRISGIPEAVEDGVTGLLVEPGQASALADALQQLIEHAERRAIMGDAGRARAREYFDLAVSSERLADAFQRVTGTWRPASAGRPENGGSG